MIFDNEVYIRIGEAFKQHRLKYGLSQEDVANKLGITQAQYSKFENGLKGSGIDKLSNIFSYAKTLGIPEEIIMTTKHESNLFEEKDKLYFQPIRSYIYQVDFDRLSNRIDFLGDVKKIDLIIGCESLNVDTIAIVAQVVQPEGENITIIRLYCTSNYNKFHLYHPLTTEEYFRTPTESSWKKYLKDEDIESEIVKLCEHYAYAKQASDDGQPSWGKVFEDLFDSNYDSGYLYVRESFWEYAYQYPLNGAHTVDNLLKLKKVDSLEPLIKKAFRQYKKKYIDYQDDGFYPNIIFKVTDENFILYFMDKNGLLDSEYATVKKAIRETIHLYRVNDDEKQEWLKQTEEFRNKPFEERFKIDWDGLKDFIEHPDPNWQPKRLPLESNTWIK